MAQPLPAPKLYTVAEYLAVGETEPGYTELSEGRLIMVPGRSPDHNTVAARLWMALLQQLPPELEPILDVDIDLELVPPDQPGYSRRPHLIVARRSARTRVREQGGAIRASEVVLVVEIVSPGSVRTDTVVKRGEYADAGIPHSWIVDATEPVSVLTCHQAPGFGYADGGEVTGTLRVVEPFVAEVDLGSLLS